MTTEPTFDVHPIHEEIPEEPVAAAVAPGSLKAERRARRQSQMEQILDGESHVYSSAHGGVIVSIEWLHSLGVDLEGQIQSPGLAKEVLLKLVKGGHPDFVHLGESNLATAIETYANSPDASFRVTRSVQQGDRYALIRLGKQSYSILGMPPGVDHAWDIGSKYSHYLLSHSSMRAIGYLDTMSPEAYKVFVKELCNALKEQTGLEALPESRAALETKALRKELAKAAVSRPGAYALAFQSHPFMSSLVGEETFKAYLARAGLGGGTPSSGGGFDFDPSLSKQDRERVSRFFQSISKPGASSASGKVERIQVTPEFVQLIARIEDHPQREAIAARIAGAQGSGNPGAVSAEKLSRLIQEEAFNAKLALAGQPLVNAPGQSSAKSNARVKGDLILPDSAFAKEPTTIGFEPALAVTDLAPLTTVTWVIHPAGEPSAAFHAIAQSFDPAAPILEEIELPRRGIYSITARVEHSNYATNFFEAELTVAPSRDEWGAMTVAEIFDELERLGETLQRDAILYLTEIAPEKLAAWITEVARDPAKRVYIDRVAEALDHIVRNNAELLMVIGESLAALTPKNLYDFFTAFAYAGLLITFGVPIAMMLAALYAIDEALFYDLWLLLDNEVLAPLINMARDVLEPILVYLIDRYWPVGYGVALDLGVGLTFIRLDLEGAYYTHLVRTSSRDLTLYSRGRAGAGASFGKGKGKTNAKGKGKGNTREVSVGAGVMGNLITVQRHVFPVISERGGDSLLGFLVTLTKAQDLALAGSAFSESIDEINPAQWLDHRKLEVRGDAEANASARYQRVAQGNAREDGQHERWNKREGRPKSLGSPTWLQEFLGLKLGIDIAAMLSMGIGVELTDIDQEQGTATLVFYGEASLLMNVGLHIPLVGNPLGMLPNISGGGGVRLKYPVRDLNTEPEVDEAGVKLSVYLKTGDLDTYEAGGTDIDFELQTPELSADLQELWQNMTQVTLYRRFAFGPVLGRGFRKYALKNQFYPQRLAAEHEQRGFELKGFLDFRATLPDQAVRDIVEKLLSLGSVQSLDQALGTLKDVLSGQPSKDAEILEEIVKILHEYLDLALIRIAGGAAWSTGNDLEVARVDGHVKALGIYEQDITDALKNPSAESLEALNGLFQEAQGRMS